MPEVLYRSGHGGAVSFCTAHEGVYIPRRDAGSLLTHLAGGRIFPGEHQPAAFRVQDTGETIELKMNSADGLVQVEVAGSMAAELPSTSIFRTVNEASAFFEPGVVGYSATGARGGVGRSSIRC